MTGRFAEWQPRYAERGIATVPVDADRKAPTVKRPERFGIPASTQLIRRFPEANALGFITGQRNNISVLDVDTDDERVLADALNCHGHTPFIVRTASGKYHAYYRHNGERRRIRPFSGLPIDIIGAGLIIAAPSENQRGTYQIVQGKLDDLDHLPSIRFAAPALERGTEIREGQRNRTLFEHCMRHAHHCDSFDALLDVACTFNDQVNMQPLHDSEVVKTARSVWGYTERGQNRFGQIGAFYSRSEINHLVTAGRAMQDVFVLEAYLKANNRRDGEFWIANGLVNQLGWTLRRLQGARKRMVEHRRIVQTRKALPGGPATYRWPS